MPNNKIAKQERDEFKELDAAGLRTKLDEEKRNQWTLRFTLGKRALEKTADLRKSKKRIARINTYLRTLELGAKTNV